MRRYSRADLSEVPSPHPPFQHQMRMQIRSIISQHHKRKKFKRSHRNGSDESRDPSPVSPEITSLTNLNLNVKKSPYCKSIKKII